MKIEGKRWTEEQFDQLSWHDNSVHGIRLTEGEHGTGLLTLDLDFILEWSKSEQGHFEFLIAAADLEFRDVWAPAIHLDYSSCAMGPFSVMGIERTYQEREFYTAQVWTIEVTFPKGEIRFEASGFVQTLRNKPIWTSAQVLTPDERK